MEARHLRKSQRGVTPTLHSTLFDSTTHEDCRLQRAGSEFLIEDPGDERNPGGFEIVGFSLVPEDDAFRAARLRDPAWFLPAVAFVECRDVTFRWEHFAKQRCIAPAISSKSGKIAYASRQQHCQPLTVVAAMATNGVARGARVKRRRRRAWQQVVYGRLRGSACSRLTYATSSRTVSAASCGDGGGVPWQRASRKNSPSSRYRPAHPSRRSARYRKYPPGVSS